MSGVLTGSAGTVNIEGNDTFTATNLTYNGGDVINGGAGSDDVLNVSLAAAQSGNATVVGVETINVTASNFYSAAYVATGVVTSGTTINLSNPAPGAPFTVSGLGSGATVNATGVSGALSLLTTAATSQTVTLNANSASSQTVTLTGSGVTDVATLTAAGTVALTVAAVETVNLSGNGAAATYTVTGTAGQTFNLTGSQSVTLSGAAATFAGDTLNDNTTAGTTTVKITENTATSFDLSKVAADVIDLNASDNAVTYSVKPGQAIKISDATTTEVPTFDINDNVSGNITTGAISIDLQGVLTTAKGITLNATTSDDYINALTITNSTSDNATAKLIAANADVTVNGTKVLTLEAASTAKSVNASGLSGVLTVTYDNSSDIATVTGGSGNDIFLSTTAPATQVTINGGAGNDTFTMLSTAKAVIDGGTGTDTLILTASADASSLALSNLEAITLANGSTAATIAATFKASQLSGKNYVIAGAGADDSIVVGGTNLYVDSTTIDLSQLVLDTTNIPTTSVTLTSTGHLSNTIAPGASFSVTGTAVRDTINLSALSGSTTIDGGGESDIITGGAGADSIIGGAGNDTITGASGADSITAGAGSDTIYFYNAIGNAATATNNSAGYASQVAGSDSIYLGAGGTATDGVADKVQWAGAESGGYVATAASLANGLTSAIAGFKADGTKHIYGFDSSDVIEFKNGLLYSANTTAITNGTATAQALNNTANFTASVTDAASNPFIEITEDLNATQVAGGATSVAAFLSGTVNQSMQVVFAIDDGTDSYLWLFAGTSTDAAIVGASELTLIGVVHGVTSFTAGDFAVVA